MSSNTPNYNLVKPGVNDPTDQDLWGAMLNGNMDIIDSTMKTISNSATLPVGSIYINANDSTNPATLFGYGTWTSFGAGRLLMGVGTGTDSNGATYNATVGSTVGEYQHTLTVNEIPAHDHDLSQNGPSNVGLGANTSDIGRGNTGFNPAYKTSSVGGGASHNNMQPSIAVYIWMRSA